MKNTPQKNIYLAKYRKKNRKKLNLAKRLNYQNNRETTLTRNKKWQNKNHQKVLETNRKYWWDNREKLLKDQKEYRLNHLEEEKIRAKEGYKKRKDTPEHKEYWKNYREKNKDRLRKMKLDYQHRREKEDPDYALIRRMKLLTKEKFGYYLKGWNVNEDKKYPIDIQWTVKKLKEKTPPEILNQYINAKKEYHIDHIIPCSVLFQVEKENRSNVLKLLFHPDNLRIIPANENLPKHTTVPQFDSLPEPTKQIAIQLKSLLNRDIFTPTKD